MLYGWMKSLIIYLIFAGAVINLSPSGSYKKYIRFFTGLVAIVILMKPISYIFNFDESKLYSSFDSISSFGQYGEEQDIYEDMMNYYDLSLSEGIKLELNKRGFSVEEVSVIADANNQLLKCTIYIDKSSEIERNFEENNIKNYIFQVYNLQVDNIYVVRR